MLKHNVPDRVVRAEVGVSITDDPGVAVGLVSDDRQRLVEAHSFARLT